MQSESNHIDNFFCRKDAASAADSSMMDTHWKQMQEMMNIHPVSKTPITISYKIILQYAAIILLIAAGIFFVLQSNRHNKSIAIKPSNESTTQPASEMTPGNTGTILPDQAIDTSLIVIGKQKTKNASQKTKKVYPEKETVDNNNDKRQETKEQDLLPGNRSTVTTKEQEKKYDNASVFKQFYSDIKKEPEYFKINASRDTTIVCKEGTTVFIPANTFQTMSGESASGPITFAIKEFYSIADIISSNLTTVSNGKQLITGGMLNIAAVANDKPLQIKQGSFIDLKMPTRVFNAQMQLFTGQENSMSFTTPNQEKQTVNAKIDYDKKTITVDTPSMDYTSSASLSFFNEGINWIPAGQQQFFFDDKKKEITLFDVQDNSRVVYRKNKSIAKYLIPYDCPWTIDEMEKKLTDKYGKYYDEIKVRRAWKPWSKKRRVNNPIDWTDWREDEYFVGDSVVMPLRSAMRRKLITREDSIRYEMEFKRKYDEAVKRNESYNDFVQQKKSYDFRITGLGWINCDRYLNYPPGRLSEFYVKTPEGYEGIYFASMLLFEKDRSAMAGSWDFNGRISFPKIPLGERVSLICLGAKEGKMYASVQQLFIERDPNIILKLEEVTPEQFKEKLRRFGNVQGIN